MASSPSDPRAPGKLPIRQASRKFMTFYEADPTGNILGRLPIAA